jgi:hypothetical protein
MNLETIALVIPDNVVIYCTYSPRLSRVLCVRIGRQTNLLTICLISYRITGIREYI